MKKTYVSPMTESYQMLAQCLMAGSDTFDQTKDQNNITVSNEEVDELNSRRRGSFWDDED
ncbi:MAG: hypothetical protein IJV45_05725 [Prevotella sp.]|nr:hypothetical protein [Prevotella sp.]